MILSSAPVIEMGLYTIPVGLQSTLKWTFLSLLLIFSVKHEPTIMIELPREIGWEYFCMGTTVLNKSGMIDFQELIEYRWIPATYNIQKGDS
jgi:hypothetical protein